MTEQPVQPTQSWTPGAKRTLSADDLKAWQDRIDRSMQKAKTVWPQWQRGLKRYGEVVVNEAKKEVNALLDYRHVESKKAQLYHRTPEIALLPIDPEDPTIPYGAILPLRQKFLSHELGPKAANAKRALHKTLVETLAASGWMAVEIGFEQVALPTQVSPPSLLGIPQPPMTVQVPIWSRRFIEPIPCKKLLVPDDFLDSSRFDAAPWLGYRGTMPIRQARRLGWKIPPDFEGSTSEDDSVFEHEGFPKQAPEKSVHFTKVWMQAGLYDEAVFNPELFRCLILVDGLEEPAWYVDSPFQALTPQGSLSPDSLRGNPIHMGTLRDMPDSAYVSSDLVVGEQLSTELNQFRTDLIRNRRSRRSIRMASAGLGKEIIDKVARNEDVVVVPDEWIEPGGQQRAVAQTQIGSEPRDNFAAQDVIETDFERAMGAGANQQGQFAKQNRTATEVRTVQGNSDARAETERDRIREYVVAMFEKFDVIVQRTATQQEVMQVLGMQGAALWQQWRALPGRYTYNMLPDAGRYVDIRQARAEAVDLYNMVRKDDRVNPEALLQHLARVFQLDEAKFMAPPSGKAMEPPKQSISWKVEDFHDPLGGQTFLELAEQSGLKLSPELVTLFKAAAIVATMAGSVGGKNPDGSPAGEASHGGPAEKTEPIDKHQRDVTGGVQGTVQ